MDHVIKFNMPWLRHHVKRLHDTDEQVNTDSIVFCYDEGQMPRGAEDGIMPKADSYLIFISYFQCLKFAGFPR